jgi:hypothetical protein
MAKSRLRGFFAYRKDLTTTVEKVVKSKTQKLDKKGNPLIENGKPVYVVTEEVVKYNPVLPFVIRTNAAVPFDHKMLK